MVQAKLWKSCYHLFKHVVSIMWRLRWSEGWISGLLCEHFLIVTVLFLKYDLSILAMTTQWRVSLRLALYPPGAFVSSDVGMDKHVSSAGSDFQPWDWGIWGVGLWGGGGFDHLFFLPPSLSTHPEQTGPGPCPGLNPFHQSDLREKHSSIPEKRSHIYRSSGNRRRLMKCRPALQRKRAIVWN